MCNTGIYPRHVLYIELMYYTYICHTCNTPYFYTCNTPKTPHMCYRCSTTDQVAMRLLTSARRHELIETEDYLPIPKMNGSITSLIVMLMYM